MSQEDLSPDELSVLIEKLIDQQASTNEVRRLETALVASAAYREIYREAMRTHASLAWQRRWTPQVGAEIPRPAEGVSSNVRSMKEDETGLPVRTNSARRWPSEVSWVLAVLAVSLLLVTALVGRRHLIENRSVIADAKQQAAMPQRHIPVPQPAEAISAIAKIGEAIGVQWMDDTRFPVGAPIAPGWVRLQSGTIRIDFFSGARLVVEGPAALELRSEWEAYLASGSVSCRVSQRGRGFRLQAKGMDVVDLGTEFGMKVGASGQPEVHVFDGKVAVKDDFNSGSIEIIQQQALQLVDGTLAQAEYSQTGFTTLDDLNRRAEKVQSERLNQWKSASQKLSNDPATLVHYTLDGQQRGDLEITNQAAHAMDHTDAAIVGCRLSEGRWPGKRSIEFRGRGDRLLFEHHGSYDQLTSIIWARVDDLAQELTGLLMTEVPNRRSLSAAGRDQPSGIEEIRAFESAPNKLFRWEIGKSGILFFNTYRGPADPIIAAWDSYLTAERVTQDQFGLWTQLAVVYDSRRKEITQYLNGDIIDRRSTHNDDPLLLGRLVVGNLSLSQEEESISGPRQFIGGIDEVFIASRALSPEEVRANWIIGKP